MKDIATNKIGGDLFNDLDLIFEDESLLNTGATISAEFLLAQVMGGSQLNIVAGVDGLATGVGETIVLSLVTSPTSGGTFDNEIWTSTIPASTTFAAGAAIAQYLPTRDISEIYTKLIVTTDYDATAQTLTAYPVGVGRQ